MEKRLWMFLAGIIGMMAVVSLVGWQRQGLPAVDPSWLKPPTIHEEAPQSQTVATATAIPSANAASSTVKQANASVVKVVDGDTIDAKLDDEGKVYRIRFLGINTPETVDPRRPVQCFGKEASNKMKELLTGKRIRLEADPEADERDKYGRLLRNVYLEDGTDVNAYMVREGYAYAYLSFPLNAKRKKELRKLQEDAKMAGRGLWNPEACEGLK
jgi:micrococcal nuclease